MELPELWFMNEDPDVMWDFDQVLLRDERLGLQNTRQLRLAEYALRNSAGISSSDDVSLPKDFPTLRLAMPQEAIAPDFFHYDGYRIVSRRLRDVVAQPEDVIQFIPIELVSGSPQARAQHYQLMRLLARQPAMDLDRSECTLEDFTDRITGQPRKRAVFIDRFVLLDNLQPRTEIFRVDEAPTRILASEGIAHRVLLAGCTGMEFADPANRWSGMRIERYRTVNGTAERRVHFLD